MQCPSVPIHIHRSIDESRLKIKDPPTPFLPSIQIGSVDTTDPERVPLDG